MKILTIALLLFFRVFIYAQPIINSFSPSAGPAGSTVIINGLNFSSTPSSNTVYFGAVKGFITSASINSLSVTVPYGASFQPISVTTNGLSGYSSKPFIVTFPNGGRIDEKSFSQRVDSSTGLYPYTVIEADIDGDGNPELLTANKDSNNISILRNNSSNGNISFEIQKNFACGREVYSLLAADLDGDGKLDIAVAALDGLCLFRNTSTTGNISFDTRQDISSDFVNFFRDIACADFDGDGRPDIILGANGSNQLSVFRNTSSVNSISFDLSSGVSTGSFYSSFCIRTVDFDGDLKTDIALTYNAPYFTVLKNTSTIGNISFVVPIANIPLPSSSAPRGLAIGDMDNDGKADVVIADHFTDSISILKNNSTTNTISFEPRMDIQSGSAGTPRSLAINDMDGDGKVDLVAVYAYFTTARGLPLSVFKNISTGDSIKLAKPVFFTPANAAWSISLTDLNKDGKADIATANSGGSATVSILRNKIGETIYLCSGGSSSIICPLTGANYQWQVSTDSVLFTNISNNLNYIGATSPTLQLNSIPSLFYGRQYRCIVDGNYSTAFTIEFENRWVGAINSLWEEPNNWSCGVIPDSNTDVIIDTGAVFLGSNQTIRSLKLNSTASLTVTDGHSLIVVY